MVLGDVAQGRLGSVRFTVRPAHLRVFSSLNGWDPVPRSRAEGEPQHHTAAPRALSTHLSRAEGRG